MQNQAHARAHLCAQTQTHANPARANALPARPTGRNHLIARWVPRANGGLEIRWQPRVQPRTLITRSRRARG